MSGKREKYNDNFEILDKVFYIFLSLLSRDIMTLSEAIQTWILPSQA